MQFFTIYLVLVSLATAAILPERSTCSTPDGSGTCVKTSSCSGFSVPGYCPGASDIQCCVSKTCSTPSGSGSCKNTGNGCSGGAFVAGYCPGSSDVECCVKGASTSAPTCKTPSGSGTCKMTNTGCSGGAFIPGYCPGTSAEQCCVKGATGFGAPITGSEIVTRGLYWIDKHVPYNQEGSYPDIDGTDYRTDCSGFVSMCLHISPPGLTTVSLTEVAVKISWDELVPGDFVGTLGAGTEGDDGHVTLFRSWVDASTKKEYNSLECRGTAYGCIAYQRPIAWTDGSFTSAPYRYTNLKS